MAEAFRLEVAGWEDLTSPQDATTPSSAPGNDPPTANGPLVNEPEPSAKRRRLSLSLNCPTRFEFLDEAREALSKKFVPKNTEKSTQWALSTVLMWRDKRNECFKEQPEKQVPLDLLGSTDSAAICKWLGLYVAEVRKKDGAEYPLKRYICSQLGFLDTCVPRMSLALIFWTLEIHYFHIFTMSWTTF